eukprot:11395881-Heterocapsa_arctica.AAC.1
MAPSAVLTDWMECLRASSRSPWSNSLFQRSAKAETSEGVTSFWRVTMALPLETTTPMQMME